MLKLSEIHQGDCLELMEEIDDQSIDMILCDLPYGTTKCKWDVVIPFPLLWYQYRRIIKPNGAVVLFATQPFTTAMIQSNLKNYKYSWVWDKVKPVGHLVARLRPMQQTEDICVFGYNAIKYNPQETERDVPRWSREYGRTESIGGRSNNDGSLLTHKQPTNLLRFSKEGKEHPTQKPVALCEYLIRTYTDKGDLVLDNCIGSGTTAVACENLGRQWIGIESDAKYVKIARNRIANATTNLLIKGSQ